MCVSTETGKTGGKKRDAPDTDAGVLDFAAGGSSPTGHPEAKKPKPGPTGPTRQSPFQPGPPPSGPPSGGFQPGPPPGSVRPTPSKDDDGYLAEAPGPSLTPGEHPGRKGKGDSKGQGKGEGRGKGKGKGTGKGTGKAPPHPP